MAKTIDYRSDFSFLLEIKDKEGNVLPLRDLDFEGHAYTALKPGFAFACKEGVCRNCTMRGDKVLIICDRHGLRPGEVKVELSVHYPDELYPDGIRTEFLTVTTGITLGYGCNCKPSETIAKVTATTPTYIKGNSNAKTFRLSEYCARGMISSASQPGVIYACDRMKFPRRAALRQYIENGKREIFEVDLTRLLGDHVIPDNFQEDTNWEFWLDVKPNDGHQYLYYRLSDRVDIKDWATSYPIAPLTYGFDGYSFRYIDREGRVEATNAQRPKREYPSYLPNMFYNDTCRAILCDLPGLYQLQRREWVKREGYKKKLKKWCNIQLEKNTQNARAFSGSQLFDRLQKFKCGVFRIRRISNKKNPRRRSEWMTFSLCYDPVFLKIKKL